VRYRWILVAAARKDIPLKAFEAAVRKCFTLEGAAAELGVSISTVKRRLEEEGGENPYSLALAKERARKGDAAEAAIWRSALGDAAFWKLTEHAPTAAEEENASKPNPISQIWLSKNVLGWKDKPEVDPKELDDDDLDRLAIEILSEVRGRENLPKKVKARAKELADEIEETAG
jgi:AraC-like DNA-binding protein